MTVKSRIPYTRALAEQFYSLCTQGKTLTQIANDMGILKDILLDWSKDKINKHEFTVAWNRGKEACQAYHENLLDCMINKKDPLTGETRTYSSKEIEAQIYRLKVRFKQDWSDKQPDTVINNNTTNTTNYTGLSVEEIDRQITAYGRKIAKINTATDINIKLTEDTIPDDQRVN